MSQFCNHSKPLGKTCMKCPGGIASIQDVKLLELLFNKIIKLSFEIKEYEIEIEKLKIELETSERLRKSALIANTKIRKERNKAQKKLENKLWDDYPDKWEN